jgi:hypothetical protein
MADYTIQLSVSIAPGVDPQQLQMALNNYAKEPLTRSVRVGLTAALMTRSQPFLEPICEVLSVTVDRKE